MSWLNGVLPVDKPEGPTSHDIVALARRRLGLRRIGHTGTLDPFASGLLLLCLGPATRLAEYLTPLPKSYRVTMRLGIVTDTDDREGEVLRRSEAWREVTAARLASALATQRGEIVQVPPRFSAKKVSGERMYDVARRGGVVEAASVPVTVYRLVVTRFEPPEVDFEVDCSSGTYIRAIARDVGEALGVGGHLVSLRRTRIGIHAVEDALAPDALSDWDAVAGTLLSPARVVAHLPTLELESEEIEIVAHGGWLPARAAAAAEQGSPAGTGSGGVAPAGAGTGAQPGREAGTGLVALLSRDGDLVAIAEIGAKRIQPRKVFR